MPRHKYKMEKTRRYDSSVSLVRVVAMLFVIICHLASYFSANTLAMFFNVGVHIFFLISGYLYGSKHIENTFEWLFKRYLRLVIPSLIWLSIVAISALVHHKALPQIHEVVFLVLNLQGLNFIFSAMEDLFIGPWFFTNIMGCYILFAIYYNIREKNQRIDRFFSYGGIKPLLLFIILGCLRISTDGALAFFIGVNLKRKGLLDKKSNKNIVIAIAVFLLAILFRVVGKITVDDTVFYDEIISPLTHVWIACSVLVSVKWLSNVSPNLVDYLADLKIVRHMDKISIYVYIIHSFFISDIIVDVFKMGYSVPIAMILFFCVVFIFSTLVSLFGDYLMKKIEYLILNLTA